MEGYIGEIRFFAGNFAPRGWMFCDGEMLTIQEYTPLFAIISSYYGGDARTNFALPDLRQKVAIGTGRGPGLSYYQLSQRGGASQLTLSEQQMPQHSHTMKAAQGNGDLNSPSGAYPAASNGVITAGRDSYTYQNAAYSNQTPNTQMNGAAIGEAGQSIPHNNMQPYLACNYIICVNGLFPSRN
ncbi:phage tail protein [Labilibaculum manganireducens]|nr:tail fiber protein [Labilibaculum manganireducens]